MKNILLALLFLIALPAQAAVTIHGGTSFASTDEAKILAAEFTTTQLTESVGFMLGIEIEDRERKNEFMGVHYKWEFIKDLATLNLGGSYWNNELRGTGGNFQFYAGLHAQLYKRGNFFAGAGLDHWSNGRSAFGRDTINSNPSRTVFGGFAGWHLSSF